MKTWGPHALPLVSLDEALQEISRHIRPIGSERVNIFDALGRTLAESITAREDHPPFDRAMMDGYAVRSADCTLPGARLRVVGQAAAGGASPRGIENGETVRINTGAELPRGADAVVAVETTSTLEDGLIVVIERPARPEQNIARRGCHRRNGEMLVTGPCRIGATQIAAIASTGFAEVSVARHVQAAIVSTGDELVLPGQRRGAGQIFESNGLTLAALLGEWGATAMNRGIVPDNREALRVAFREALQYPIVLTVGGMSMGTLDLVPTVMRELDVDWRFHGVNLRPGKPTAYGVGPEGQHVLGLPGNPVSAFVCAMLFARPIIRGMQGYPILPPRRTAARLDEALPAAKDSRPAFLPAVVRIDESATLRVRPTHWGGSADVFGLAESNALLVRGEPAQSAAKDSLVDILLFNEPD